MRPPNDDDLPSFMRREPVPARVTATWPDGRSVTFAESWPTGSTTITGDGKLAKLIERKLDEAMPLVIMDVSDAEMRAANFAIYAGNVPGLPRPEFEVEGVADGLIPPGGTVYDADEGRA